MCVICVKNKGVALPTERELREAWIHNPHGGGFVCSNGYYWRGMDFEDFIREFKAHVKKEDSCIIHFRLATHGSLKVSNCHPFYKDGVYFAHNGILDIKTKNDMTDSETMFLGTLLPAIKTFGLRSIPTLSIVEKVIGHSWFAFMDNGKITLFGNWTQAPDGLIWSNLNHISFYDRWDIPYKKLTGMRVY